MNGLMRKVYLLLYYGIAKQMPEHSMPRGKMWMQLRGWLTKKLLRHCGVNVSVNKGVHFGNGTTVSLGDNSSLGINARLIGDVSIGNNVGMAHNVFMSSNDREIMRQDMLLIYQGKRPDRPVVIEDDCIVFANAIILAGVRVHSGTIIGAGAVVTKDVPPNSVVAGNPARVVKWRIPPPPDADYSKMTPVTAKLAPPKETPNT